MRLQQKAVLFTLPFILIPTLLLGWMSFRYTQSAQAKIEQSTLQTDVNYRSDALNKFAESSSNTLVYLLNSSDVKSAAAKWLQNKDKQHLEANLTLPINALFNNSQNVVGVRLIDNTLKEIKTFWRGESQQIETIPLLKKYQDWFLVSENDEFYSIIQMPWFVNDATGHGKMNSVGFIQLISKPNWLETLKLDKRNGDRFFDSHQIMITDVNGKILYAYPRDNLGYELPSSVFTRLLKAADEHSLVEVKNSGDQMSFAGRMVNERYVVLFGHRKANIFEGDTTFTWIAVLTILATIIISPIVLYANFTRLIVEPIQNLASAKRQVAQGNLDVKMDSSRVDEIGELFAAFNVMVQQLIVYRENEKEGRVKLEYKVKERTEELQATNTALASSNKALATAKEQSEQANELKSAFVANISHEIRTPLTAILGFTEQVLSTELNDPQQKDLLQRVLKSGRHLLALINDILDLSKIESNKLDIDIKEVQLVDLITDVHSLLISEADRKGLVFDVDYQYPIPKNIKTDETRFRQILLNLASNAIKFTEQGRVDVKVWFQQETNRLYLQVEDTGIGMTEEVQQRLFSPFVQADVSISRKFGGTGLGLVISKSLVNLLGGDIKLKSELSKGSTFEFYIDINPNAEQFSPELIVREEQIDEIKKQIETEEKVVESAQIGGKVLVAEDVVDNQHLFQLLMSPFNIEHDFVDNGQKAVEMALINDYDLIFMDMQMPIMGGLEATQLIRQAAIDTPIYALTANVMQEDLEKHKAAGCNGTVGKPVEKSTFIKIIKKHLNQNNQQEEESLFDDEQMLALKQFYLEQLKTQKGLLDSLDSSEKLTELKAEMHKIKGSAGSYGFEQLTKEAGDLESLCEACINKEVDWEVVDQERRSIVASIESILSEGKSQGA